VAQRKDLYNPSIYVDAVVEIVLNVIQQHTSKAWYPSMWYGFACVRKLLD
jgi:hypothetical protein